MIDPTTASGMWGQHSHRTGFSRKLRYNTGGYDTEVLCFPVSGRPAGLPSIPRWNYLTHQGPSRRRVPVERLGQDGGEG